MDNDKETKQAIEQLIKKEEDEAFSIFPEDVLKSRLKTRLEAKGRRFRPLKSWVQKPVLVSFGLLLVACIALLVLVNIRSDITSKGAVSSIERSLSSLPGMQSLYELQMTAEKSLADQRAEFHGFRDEFQEVNNSVRKEPFPRDIKMYHIESQDITPKLDLYEEMKILMEERIIHQVLSEYLKNNKEAYHD